MPGDSFRRRARRRDRRGIGVFCTIAGSGTVSARHILLRIREIVKENVVALQMFPQVPISAREFGDAGLTLPGVAGRSRAI
jgi:hypothetical protein